MQMGDPCMDCKSWEEEIFWNHFQSIHFSQFLRGNFVQQLEIPEKFAKNIKKKLPEAVTLKGPSGAIWDVGLKADDDTLYFARGWKIFVKDHSLEENDFLVFKYNGVSHFDVLMFDGQSLCEKAASYFVRKCTHTDNYDSGCQTKRKMNENPVEVAHNSPPCGLQSSPEKSTNNDIDMRSPRRPNTPAATNKKMRKAVSSNRTSARRGRNGKQLTTIGGEIKVETEFDHPSVKADDVFTPQLVSRKRPATQAEKTNALLVAQEALSKEGFMVVMKPTHVGRRFYMAVPTAWVAKHMPKENDDVILRVDERTWKTRFYYHRSRDCGGLSGGWRNFVIDNSLEEDDVCVFEPDNLGQRPTILDVGIFRVLRAPVPLTQVRLDVSC